MDQQDYVDGYFRQMNIQTRGPSNSRSVFRKILLLYLKRIRVTIGSFLLVAARLKTRDLHDVPF
jgi:hypothetical protein